jgi:glycosyltransferase involved in cell wall biosynthesis
MKNNTFDLKDTPKILFLSRWFPFPPDNGSKIRIYHLIEQLVKHFTVDLISFTEEDCSIDQVKSMERLCRKIVPVQYKPFRRDDPGSFSGFFSSYPRSVVASYKPEMDLAISSLIQSEYYDVLIASQIDMARYTVNRNVPVKILEELELMAIFEHFSKETNPLRRIRYGLTWNKLIRYIRRIQANFQAFTVVSQPEKSILAGLRKIYLPIDIIPNGVETGSFRSRSDPDPNILIFPGSMTYPPNYRAMKYFVQEVFPRIRNDTPQVQLFITGNYHDVDITDFMNTPGVILTGQVPDIRSEIERAWVCVVPILSGGGTRLKILEAMVSGTPVVSTAKGAEGLDFSPNIDIYIADDPASFAEATLKLIHSPEERYRLGQQGKQTVSNLYDWEKIGKQFVDLIHLYLRNSIHEPEVNVGREIEI